MVGDDSCEDYFFTFTSLTLKKKIEKRSNVLVDRFNR